jgi:MYXO-CTERM domain-containing protein
MIRRGALAAAALVAGARWAAADPVPVLSVMPPSVDAGRVERPATTTATVRIANAGTGTLKLLALQLLDGGTGAATDWSLTPGAPCGTTVPPSCALSDGQSADLDLTFDPSSLGVRNATLLVNYHDTADRSIAIPLRGVGVGPTLEIVGAPAMLDFGTLPAGVAGTLSLNVTNHGTRDLADGAIAITPSGSPFSAGTGNLAVTTSAATSVTITCTPPAGMFTASLQLSAPEVPGPPIQIGLRCAGDPAQVLVAGPPAILLGEVRLGVPARANIGIGSQAGPIALTGAALTPAIPGLTVRGTPATTPVVLELTAAPQAEGSLDSQLTVTRTGVPLAIAVTGSAVTASVSAPSAVSLGTFCVQQPTTPRIVILTSTGSATVGLSAPALQSAMSPFDLALVAPLDYPNMLAPHERAFVAVTPRQRGDVGMVSDDLVWTTDAGAAPTLTTLTATFIASGTATMPDMLDFGEVPIHVDTHNARQVTLQNCSTGALQLDPPQVPSPFSIDSPNFPAALKPGEVEAFSVGFHPTKLDMVSKTLIITSPQLPDPLKVELTGKGVATGTGSDTGPPATGVSSTSFYACGSCTAGDPSGALAIVLAALAALAPRRRRAR